ncbi:MAG: hypothetical protein ACR2OO_10575 [Thermomicrobiales bacterium]
MKPRKFAGLGLLLAGALIVVGYQFSPWNPKPPEPKPPSSITVSGIVGNKAAFFDDPTVVQILKDRFGLTVDYRVMGSFVQTTECKAPYDYCWPDSQTAATVIKQRLGAAVLKDATIFNSPIVLYSWARVSDKLIDAGIVTKAGDTYFVNDFGTLIKMIADGNTWTNLGLPEIYGKIAIRTADPKSNSGNTYAALLANTFNGGEIVDLQTVEPILLKLPIFFRGPLLNDSTEIFQQFLNLGIGAAPIVVGYESALIEHALAQPNERQSLRDNVRTLYPQPTMWSSQNMMALTEGGKRLLAALRDPEIQQIGWTRHGFRSGATLPNDPAAVPVPGVPNTIVSVIDLPEPRVIDRIIVLLSAAPIATPVVGQVENRLLTIREGTDHLTQVGRRVAWT